MKNKKAFTFVEVIITLTIIVLISIVAFKYSTNSKEKTLNAKVESDILAINNSIKSRFSEKWEVLLPDWNRNYFKKNGAYSHEKFDDEENPAFWVYGKISENILEKKYLSKVPNDPRTWEFYSYGVSKDWKIEIAWVVNKSGTFLAKVAWDYSWESVAGLIREYNWAYFVTDQNDNLPYNPEKIVLNATDKAKNTFYEWDKINYNWQILTKNDTKIDGPIFEKFNDKFYYELFFSDGTIWKIELKNESEKFSLVLGTENSKLQIEENGKKSKLAMFLEAWKIWIFAPDMEESKSELSVETSDLTAAVRWTYFYILKNNDTEVNLFKWKLEVTYKNWWKKDLSENNDTTTKIPFPQAINSGTETNFEKVLVYKIDKSDSENKVIREEKYLKDLKGYNKWENGIYYKGDCNLCKETIELENFAKWKKDWYTLKENYDFNTYPEISWDFTAADKLIFSENCLENHLCEDKWTAKIWEKTKNPNIIKYENDYYLAPKVTFLNKEATNYFTGKTKEKDFFIDTWSEEYWIYRNVTKDWFEYVCYIDKKNANKENLSWYQKCEEVIKNIDLFCRSRDNKTVENNKKCVKFNNIDKNLSKVKFLEALTKETEQAAYIPKNIAYNFSKQKERKARNKTVINDSYIIEISFLWKKEEEKLFDFIENITETFFGYKIEISNNFVLENKKYKIILKYEKNIYYILIDEDSKKVVNEWWNYNNNFDFKNNLENIELNKYIKNIRIFSK